MKTKGIILAVIAVMAVGVGSGSGATNEVSGLLQKGLFEEEANRNLDAAIQAYQAVVAQTDKDRNFAAMALFRMGECYRKQGKTNEANVQFQRILREFPDQKEFVTMSKQYVGNAQAPPSLNTSREELSATINRKLKEDQENAEIDRLKALLKDSPDRINAQGEGGKTPLFNAVSDDQPEVAKFLLDNQANTEVRNDFARTPLIQAATRGNKAMTELLLAHGADANAAVTKAKLGPNTGLGAGEEGRTALHYAVLAGYKGVAEVLLAHGANPDAKNEEGKTPLHLGTEKGYKSVAELLLAHGANIEARRTSGATPLLEAAYAGNKAIVELLLANHADINATNGDGDTALFMTADTGSAAIADLLISSNADINFANKIGTTPLMEAVAQNRKDVADLLLKSGANVNVQEHGRNGNRVGSWTALFYAIYKDNSEMIKLLLDKGADVDVVGVVGAPSDLANPNTSVPHDFTPLMSAIFWGKAQIAQTLLDRKADINFRNPNGETALLVAVKQASTDMVELLLNHKADLTASDKNGWSLLQQAVMDWHPEIARLLLERGANPNSPFPPAPQNSFLTTADWKGITPLGYAVAAGQVDMAKLLLQHGAEVNVHTATDRTPLHAAVLNIVPIAREMIGLLLAHDANVNAIDNHGNTPLDLCGNGTNEVTELLRQHGAIRGLERGTIRVQRGEQTGIVFWRDANGYNRHKLYDVLGYVYPHPLGLAYVSDTTHANRQPELPGFYFPDFAHIRILHVENKAVSGIRTNIVTFDSLATALNDGDCSVNFALNWGDVVELPELDHNVSDKWQGLSEREKESIKKCLERHVKIIVKGKETRLTLSPNVSTNRAAVANASPVTELPIFWLSDVVRGARVILASSDVTRMKVKHAHPVSEKPDVMVFDLNKIDAHSDLWLEDGDVIEIPEKSE